jgi:hypothetical protein
MLPLQILFLAATPFIPLVGNGMNQADYVDIRLYLITKPQQGLPLSILPACFEEDATASSSFSLTNLYRSSVNRVK